MNQQNLKRKKTKKEKKCHIKYINIKDRNNTKATLERKDINEKYSIKTSNTQDMDNLISTLNKEQEKYKSFLKENGEIYFKTDDDDLFNSSLNYFEEAGFEIIKKTYDLHSQADFWYNIETEHEKMFSEQGIKIKALVARR